MTVPSGKFDVAVDDRAADAAVPADIYVIEDDRFLDVAIAVDPHIIADDRALDPPA